MVVIHRGQCTIPFYGEWTAKGAANWMLQGDTECFAISGVACDGRPAKWFTVAGFGVSGLES
jgi:hypothetical protein